MLQLVRRWLRKRVLWTAAKLEERSSFPSRGKWPFAVVSKPKAPGLRELSDQLNGIILVKARYETSS